MVNKTTLDNGVRVITEEIPASHSISLGFWVTNGSRHEEHASNGVAHFIEHLLFKGTPSRTAHQIAREIDSVGGLLNAFTSREYVCYYTKVLHRYLPKAVDLLSDIFLHSLFDSDEIEKERKVILQEINMLEDTPDDYIHDLFSQNFWKGHPLGMPIIGREESVGSFGRDFLLAYKEGNYRAEDVIVAAAGRLEHDELLQLLQPFLAAIPCGSGNHRTAPPEPCNEKRVQLFERDLEQVHLCLGTKALPQIHDDRFAGLILNTVLGGSMSSRLFQEVREKRGLAYSVYSYLTSHSDTGSLTIYAGTSREQLDEVVEIIIRELRRLRDQQFPTDELAMAREQLKGNILLSLESTDNRMSKLAKNEIYFGCYQPLVEIERGFDNVTAERLHGLCREIISDHCITLVVMGRVSDGTITDQQLVI